MFMGQDGFVWWLGVVESVADPYLLGRIKVRIFGYHAPYQTSEEVATAEANRTPISELPWAHVVLPTNMPDAYGKPRLGDWVLGFFLDGKEAQEPVVLGYIPGLGTSQSFGKNIATTRNFSQVFGGQLYNGDSNGFSSLLNRFSFQTPAGHKIEFVDDLSPSQNREVSLVHGNGAYHKMVTDQYGSSTITIGHPSGSYIQLRSDGGIDVVAHYPGIVQNLQIGTPPPEPSGGGDCFTKNSLVTLANGRVKRICDIEVGDYVLSECCTKANRVMFIEKVIDTTWESLYTPDDTYEPFATINHPLFLNGKLSSPNAERVQKLYPWLGKIEQLHNCKIVPTTGETVYNLWVDGDGTYVINGYGTTSIMMDGGLLRIAHERGYLSHDEVMDLVLEFTSDTANLQYGAYIVNGIVGRINVDALTKFFAWVSKKPKSFLLRKMVVGTMRFASLIARLIYRR